MKTQFNLLLYLTITYSTAIAQEDSTLRSLQHIPVKYVKTIRHKVDKYHEQVSTKTIRALEKLSYYENRIRMVIEKINSSTAIRLFGPNQQTFRSVLEKLRAGNLKLDQLIKYDEYRDKLTTSLNFLALQEENIDEQMLNPLKTTILKLSELNDKLDETTALEQFIAKRKKELASTAVQYIGNSKYISKINKEAWYYLESMKNYKTIFNDPKRVELIVKKLLSQIPVFERFVQTNSLLAALFPTPENYGNVASLNGLQTLTDMQEKIAGRIGTTIPTGIHQNLQEAHNKINDLRNRLVKTGSSSSESLNTPDFNPNHQRTKTLKQRIELTFNYQFSTQNRLGPSVMDISTNLGYKLNDKSVIGIGVVYKLGIGSIKNLKISHRGAGIRSFIDWKINHLLFISGGFEISYNSVLSTLQIFKNYEAWQQSGLIGVAKRLPIRSKMIKEAKLQLLFDMLARTHAPTSPQILLRMGYSF